VASILIVFGVYTLLAGVYDWYVYGVLKTLRALRDRGVPTIAHIIDVGSTTGGLAVSSTVVKYRFELKGQGRFDNRVVLSAPLPSGPPRVGQAIDVVYLAEAPSRSQIVGNAGHSRSLFVPLVPLNLLWLALLVVVVMEVLGIDA